MSQEGLIKKEEGAMKKKLKIKYGILGALITLLVIFSLFVLIKFITFPFRARPHLGTQRFRIEENYPFKFSQRRGKYYKGVGYKDVIKGKVTAVGDKKFTLDYQGKSKEVQITENTRFPLDSETQIKVGDEVIVWGEQDASGIIQAYRIVVNP